MNFSPIDAQAPDWRSDRFSRSYVKTRHLVLLVELGRHGSILRAAEAANLTQPAASKTLGELEHALGLPLFERLPRGVTPTGYGKVLIRRAGAALAELAAAHQEVMVLKSGMTGSVAVGAVQTPSATLLPAAIMLLKSRHARVNVAITVDSSKLLVERLRAGELDIVIGRIHDPAAASELNFEPISDEAHRLIARAGHPLARQSGLGLRELAQQAWILPPAGSILRDRITALFLTQGLEEPSEIVSATCIPTVIRLLMGSDMVAPLPVELVQPYLDNGLMVALPFDLNLRTEVYGLVTRRRHQVSPAADRMLEALREAVAARHTAVRDINGQGHRLAEARQESPVRAVLT